MCVCEQCISKRVVLDLNTKIKNNFLNKFKLLIQFPVIIPSIEIYDKCIRSIVIFHVALCRVTLPTGHRCIFNGRKVILLLQRA